MLIKRITFFNKIKITEILNAKKIIHKPFGIWRKSTFIKPTAIMLKAKANKITNYSGPDL